MTQCTKISPWDKSIPNKYVVVLSRYQGKLLLSRHRERSTWETQGGHIEPGEDPEAAARRELWEESGAIDFVLEPLFMYWATDRAGAQRGEVLADGKSRSGEATPAANQADGPCPRPLGAPETDLPGAWGAVFFADIKELGPIPESEMAEVRQFDGLPENLTYPGITPDLYEQVKDRFENGKNQESHMNVRILINPNAGKQVVMKELHNVYQAFADCGSQPVMELSVNAEHAAATLDRAIAARPDILVCCGGDGTLSATVDGLLNSGADIPLGYIPAGTTNDFANFLGLPKEPAQAAQLIAQGEAAPIDAGRFGDKHFIYVASFGAFTQTSYATTQSLKNSMGHLAYVVEGIKELPALKSYSVRAETAEGDVYEGEYLFGSVSNSTSLGGIIKLDSDKVDPIDGKFELTLVRVPQNLRELNAILWSLMSGQPDEELITFVHTRKVTFTCAEPMPWSLDGEYCSGHTDVEVEVLPGSLRLFRSQGGDTLKL